MSTPPPVVDKRFPYLCVECRHYQALEGRDESRPHISTISHTCARGVNVVTGEPLLTYCDWMRSTGPCGIGGDLFEPMGPAGAVKVARYITGGK